MLLDLVQDINCHRATAEVDTFAIGIHIQVAEDTARHQSATRISSNGIAINIFAVRGTDIELGAIWDNVRVYGNASNCGRSACGGSAASGVGGTAANNLPRIAFRLPGSIHERALWGDGDTGCYGRRFCFRADQHDFIHWFGHDFFVNDL